MKGYSRKDGEEFPWVSFLPKTKTLRTELHDIDVSDRVSALTLHALGEEIILSEGLSNGIEITQEEMEAEVEMLLLEGIGEETE